MQSIERTDSIGGVCIHTGTIPSKAIREAVLHLTGIRERSVYGESYAVKHNIHMSDLLYRAEHVVRTEVDVIRNQMERNGITLVFGTASFVDANTDQRHPRRTKHAGARRKTSWSPSAPCPRGRVRVPFTAEQSHRQQRTAEL